MRIPITKTSFGPEEFEMIQRPLQSGWVVQGPFVEQFEALFSEFTGAPYSVAVSSCTTGLQLAVAALGTEQGDEVIVPAFTWVATANAVEHLGARAVFADVGLDTFNINPEHTAALVTRRTVGLLPVHLFGLPADLRSLVSLADRSQLWLVEDAACAFGAEHDGRHVGTHGEIGAFSFHPRKAITTGEGGMLTFSDPDLAAKCQTLRDHGGTKNNEGPSYLLGNFPMRGFNFRMTDIQGALGVAQMKRARALQSARENVAVMYDTRLANIEWLQLPHRPAAAHHSMQAYVCLLRPNQLTLETIHSVEQIRNDIMGALEARGISTRQGTHAPPFLSHYREKYGYRPEDFPNAYMVERASLALPLFASMTPDECDYVVAQLLDVVPKLLAR